MTETKHTPNQYMKLIEQGLAVMVDKTAALQPPVVTPEFRKMMDTVSGALAEYQDANADFNAALESVLGHLAAGAAEMKAKREGKT